MNEAHIVNDVTQLNPVGVWAIARPSSIEEVQEALRRAAGPVSVGGGHFSMGGQTASPGSLHIDMRGMSRLLSFSPVERTVRVEAGIRWCDIQRFIDPHDLSIAIMQTYANFTVGGSLSVNVHGRYVGLGPLILSVRSITLVLADGALVRATPHDNTDFFYGAIGGYGGLGVIVEAELELARNTRVERTHVKMKTTAYGEFFRQNVRDARGAVFHNADLYAPHYSTTRATTWVETTKPVTSPYRLQRNRKSYPLERYFLWAISETPFGKWRREWLIDPLLFWSPKVHWRNYEAGYSVAELEPPSRRHRTYVLQEYFVPVARFEEFVALMGEILGRHRVNVMNVSIRHALKDPGSIMAWAREEVFAFVLYHKQRTRRSACERVGVWTRELIDAVISCGGTYYLPYQPHATPEQFHRAYPRATELFELKRRHDPGYRFRNVLWDKYYAPTLVQPAAPVAAAGPKTSEFHSVYGNVEWADRFYRFLQNVYRLYPEDRFHTLILEGVERFADDESIYRHLQKELPKIKPALADLTFALPSLRKQKAEIARQTVDILGGPRDIDGYVEIGTPGRYVKTLASSLRLRGPLVLVNDTEPSFSPVDLAERGQFTKLGSFIPLADYEPLPASIADASCDLVTCFIGLHHIPGERVDPFLRSIHRVLRPGGTFVVRDHDVRDFAMDQFVALAHTVFNAGLMAPWETNKNELRLFGPLTAWSRHLAKAGLVDTGKRLLQANDPTANTLMSFVRER
jgi:FAD/FMN-containing dehydrogenase